MRPPPPLRPDSRLAAVLREHANAEAEHRLNVVREVAETRRDEHLPHLFGERRFDLLDARVPRVSRPTRAFEERTLVAPVDLERQFLESVAIGQGRRREPDARGGAPLAMRAAVSAARFMASHDRSSTWA